MDGGEWDASSARVGMWEDGRLGQVKCRRLEWEKSGKDSDVGAAGNVEVVKVGSASSAPAEASSLGGASPMTWYRQYRWPGVAWRSAGRRRGRFLNELYEVSESPTRILLCDANIEMILAKKK